MISSSSLNPSWNFTCLEKSSQPQQIRLSPQGTLYFFLAALYHCKHLFDVCLSHQITGFMSTRYFCLDLCIMFSPRACALYVAIDWLFRSGCSSLSSIFWTVFFFLQLEDPAIRWQMALYKDLPNRTEDTSDPEKTVERVLDIANVLFHLEQVSFCVDSVTVALTL